MLACLLVPACLLFAHCGPTPSPLCVCCVLLLYLCQVALSLTAMERDLGFAGKMAKANSDILQKIAELEDVEVGGGGEAFVHPPREPTR